MSENTANSTNKSNTNSKMKKFALLLLMLILLLIPTGFWYGIIKDRESYKNEAVRSVASAWGDVQIFGSPTLSFTQPKDKTTETINLTLNHYNTDIKITTETRHKGIYKVPVYIADVKIKGDFTNNYGNLTGKELTLAFSVKDSIGFIEEPVFRVNNGKNEISQDTTYTFKLGKDEKNIPFEISYKIRGLNELFVNMGGQANKVKISGNWDNPSFTGNFLPTQRTVTDENFEADWNVPKVATTNVAIVNPETIGRHGYDEIDNGAKIGVSLLLPVDNYRMATRSLKYAFLFITLTFVSYFIFEITSSDRKRIHPLQYLLLGAAMLIFYLLLVSISEFMPFGFAYTAAAVMTIAMISSYTHFVITKCQNIKFSLVITLLLAILYTFLYTLLRLQDLALLLGSLGLFIIVALIMYATRNVDWYNEN